MLRQIDPMSRRRPPVVRSRCVAALCLVAHTSDAACFLNCSLMRAWVYTSQILQCSLRQCSWSLHTGLTCIAFSVSAASASRKSAPSPLTRERLGSGLLLGTGKSCSDRNSSCKPQPGSLNRQQSQQCTWNAGSWADAHSSGNRVCLKRTRPTKTLLPPWPCLLLKHKGHDSWSAVKKLVRRPGRGHSPCWPGFL